MLRNVQTMDYSKNSHEKHVTGETPTIDMDSGCAIEYPLDNI